MAGINNSNEPSTAPHASRWYNLTLGSSLKYPHHSSRFCTLRYEFKPASIDKNQHGTLHKSQDNNVTVEFQNNQPGKPKVTFEGISEDYKANDAVLFFDGESFRLERLNRTVKRLRHNRMQGESTATVAALAGLSDASSPPVGKGLKQQPMYKDAIHAMPVEVERIDIGDFRNPGMFLLLQNLWTEYGRDSCLSLTKGKCHMMQNQDKERLLIILNHRQGLQIHQQTIRMRMTWRCCWM